MLGAVLWILVAVGFRLSAAVGLHTSTGVATDDPTVRIIGQSVNAVVATVLWAYLASIAILVGGEFNAALASAAAGPPAPLASLSLGRLAQLARAPALHAGGRPFESDTAHLRSPPKRATLPPRVGPVRRGV